MLRRKKCTVNLVVGNKETGFLRDKFQETIKETHVGQFLYLVF